MRLLRLLLFIEWGSLSASYTVLTSSFDLILRDNQFSSSKSDRNGGAVAVILDGSTNEECRLTVDIEHCIFSNTAARTGEGEGLYQRSGDSKCCGSIAIRAKSEFNDSSSTIGGCICSSRSTTQCHSLMLDDSFVESSHAEMDGTIAHEADSERLYTVQHHISKFSQLPSQLLFHTGQYRRMFSFCGAPRCHEELSFPRESFACSTEYVPARQLCQSRDGTELQLDQRPTRTRQLRRMHRSGVLCAQSTCAGYVVAFDSLPNKVGELFASCVDTSTVFFMSVADKTGQHTFSINSETREIFANEESGHDSNMCGFQSNPCSSIHFSARASSRSAFSISAVGNFTAPAHPVILASPCMHLTSGPSAEETRACLNFSLYAVPKLRAPNNRLELSHLNFVLTTDQNDGAFFRAGQSSTHIRDILMFYPGKLHISLFFLPHTSTSKIVIDLDAHDLSFSHFKFCQVETDTLIVRARAGVVLFTDKADTVNPFTGVDLVSNRYTHKEGIGHVMTSRFGNDVTIRNKALLFAITNVRSSSIFPRVVVGDSEHAEAIDLFAPKPSNGLQDRKYHFDFSDNSLSIGIDVMK
ncbi:hypothetical protein BLNAU_24259 [Blattamonas nauphoetae]|uniref:Uncharacterized protein n=1 Tax=Blattamonas nauphoetae TaxID=2049346 RepID=A0ABQ9WMY7_9EUKA|nr:hypothetical protein BLNAU_24259 [Blattamonas nauphoetae]